MSYEKKIFCTYTSSFLSGQAQQGVTSKIPELKYARVKTSSIMQS